MCQLPWLDICPVLTGLSGPLEKNQALSSIPNVSFDLSILA